MKMSALVKTSIRSLDYLVNNSLLQSAICTLAAGVNICQPVLFEKVSSDQLLFD